jgi:hypothetical protein
MSSVHDQIALQAYAVLPAQAKRLFAPYLDDLKASSWYPDVFADTAMPTAEKLKIDPQADRFILPPPPRTAAYRKILAVTAEEARFGISPLRHMYQVEYCLQNALHCLKAGDLQSVVKYCGVFSHVVADTAEPIHALHPHIVDAVLPTPATHVGMELHANVERLAAPVDIRGYRPRPLGSRQAQVLMNSYARLDQARRIGAAQTVPIVQALYASDRPRATTLSQVAQNASARLTADFMLTIANLHGGKEKEQEDGTALDLREYPYVGTVMDMLYRYRPAIDVSLIPYSGGKFHPLAVPGRKGAAEPVKGIGMLPSLAPPYTKGTLREASATYYIVPGAYREFQARIAINPLFRETLGKSRFLVLGDGQVLFSSPPVAPGDPARPVTVPLGKTRWLTLAVRYLTCPSFAERQRLECRWAMHEVWAEPKLTNPGDPDHGPTTLS